MKIVVSANTSWYIYNFRRNTITSLIDRGAIVYVLAPKDAYTDQLRDIGCEIINLKMDAGGVNPFFDIWTFISICITLRNFRPDICLNFTPKNNIYCGLACSIFGIKAINNIAGLGAVFRRKGIIPKIVRILYRVSQRRAFCVFFQNEEDMNIFVDLGIVRPDVRHERINGSGVDLERFYPVDRTCWDTTVFLISCRMLKEKGIYLYADAAKVLKQEFGGRVEFLILGFITPNHPSAISSSEVQAWEAQGFVKYLGVSDKVEEILEGIDVMVLPSFYGEGVPRSLLEAAAMAKPVITTDNVGCRDVVDNGETGLLCESKSLSSLICKMREMVLMSPEEYQQMGAAGRKKMEQEFNENTIIQSYLSVIYSGSI